MQTVYYFPSLLYTVIQLGRKSWWLSGRNLLFNNVAQISRSNTCTTLNSPPARAPYYFYTLFYTMLSLGAIWLFYIDANKRATERHKIKQWLSQSNKHPNHFVNIKRLSTVVHGIDCECLKWSHLMERVKVIYKHVNEAKDGTYSVD